MSERKAAKKNFASSQEVKWCSGCGDYSVLKQVQLAMAELELRNENVALISGIGCSSRFPYYLNTYGYHTLHGRALAVATGVKMQNPALSVWVATGDGDALSIGGNHFVHAAKRNMDMVVVIMDNRIYGLTKGQASPTSDKGVITKTTPYGSIDNPLDPVRLALGSGATFVARAAGTNQKLLQELLVKAHQHKGFSLVHVLQNCLIFNDAVFDRYVGKEKDETTLTLRDAEPMIFGKERDKAIVLEGLKLRVANVADVDPSTILVHDARSPDSIVPGLISGLSMDEFPMPMGVIRQLDSEYYSKAMQDQMIRVTDKLGKGNLQELLRGGNTWQVA